MMSLSRSFARRATWSRVTCAALGIAASLALAACAGVNFTQLDPGTLAAKSGAPRGAIYYLPKPYLLVARLPAAPPGGAGDDHRQVYTPPAPEGQASVRPPSGWPSGYTAGAGAADAGKGDSTPPTASGSDLSFNAANETYIIKLVYLPDRSRPMSVQLTAGMGQASFKPTFQDGWMLTSFEAAADSKVSEVLGSVASIIGAAKGAGGKGGGGPAVAKGADSQVLRPGLYDFRYDDAGRLVGLCAVTYFSEGGTSPGPCGAPAAP